MKKNIVELFAGVGGFRLGFERASKEWETVWANQWEPEKKVQYAFDCYCKHFKNFGGVNEFSNVDIGKVQTHSIPNHTLLVGGFPCQDYSVAGTNSKGIEGKKGVLWWDINRILTDKRPPFILLENVDRLIKSPVKQRGRDFAVILGCLRDLGYAVEWRVINAADYGLQQRRRRIFIFGFHNSTKYYKNISKHENLLENSFFATLFPVTSFDMQIKGKLPEDILEISNSFAFPFGNSGLMIDGDIVTRKVVPMYNGPYICLKDIMEKCADKHFSLSNDLLAKFTYMKGAKKEERTTKDGFKYNYTEGPIPFPDLLDRPARTMLTSESSNNRTTHIVKDITTGELRKLTPLECERINGFSDNWTDTGMPEKFRYFCMGNALVVNLITIMAKQITQIVDSED